MTPSAETSPTRTIRTLALALGLLVLGACSVIRDPKIEHIGVREIETTETRAVYNLRFRATNPNEDPLPLAEFRYRFIAQGRELFRGVRSPQTTFGTFDEREFEVPIVLDRSAVDLRGVLEYELDAALSYVPPGRFRQELYRSKVRVPTVELRAEGRVDLDAP